MSPMKAYEGLLKKLFLIEFIGENFYESLVAREKGEVLKAVYQRLEVNERETKILIEQELGVSDSDRLTSLHKIIVALIHLFCRILPLALLKSLLKSILNRRLYSRLSEQYRSVNPGLWDALVKHEQLQHELLTPYWNQPTGGK